MSIAERLRECHHRYAERHGLYVEAAFNKLSDETGIPIRYINRWYNGHLLPPGANSLEQLARAYQTTSDWLLDGRPNVEIWQEFQETETFNTFSDPEKYIYERVKATLDWVANKYSGHMRQEDYIQHMAAVRYEGRTFNDFLTGTRIIPRPLVAHLAELWDKSQKENLVQWLLHGSEPPN